MSGATRSFAAAFLLLALALGGCNSSQSEDARPAPPQPATATISDVKGNFLRTTFRGDAQALLLFSPDEPRGEIAVTNSGSRSGYFALTQEVVASRPATGPARAEGQVDLTLREVVEDGRPRLLYQGPVAGFDPVTVGPVKPRAERRFRFRFSGGRRPLLSLVYRWPTTGPPDDLPAPAKPAPRVRLRLEVPRSQRVLDMRAFFVRARCNRPCRFSGEGQMRVGSRPPADLVGRPYRRTRSARAVVLAFRFPASSVAPLQRAISGRARAVARVRVRATSSGRLPTTRSTSIRITGVPGGR